MYTDYPTASPLDQLLPINHGAKNRALNSKPTTFHPTNWHHAKKYLYLKWHRFFLRLQKYRRYLQHPLSPASPNTERYHKESLLQSKADYPAYLHNILPRLLVHALIFFFWCTLRTAVLQAFQSLSYCLLLFTAHLVEAILTLLPLLLKWVKESNDQ